MSRLRFTTAHEVLDTFPQARADIGREVPDAEPLACLDALAAADAGGAAVAFCAYLLPRREAVWWACRALRLLLPMPTRNDDAALKAAEAWAVAPDDARRRAALDLALASDLASPWPWPALSAGWAGGSMSPGEHAVAVPPHLTAKAVRAALLLGLAQVPPKSRGEKARQCLAIGRRLATGEEAVPPGQRR
ncbi:MAG TPA: hypothetical protein VH414_16825 [Lichenihabitans sp.]|jgi:hypothetical protein|nr:hypothetical protein [Lichenihabitans sp.]